MSAPDDWGPDYDAGEVQTYVEAMATFMGDDLFNAEGDIRPVPPSYLGPARLPTSWPASILRLIEDSGIAPEVFKARGYQLIGGAEARRLGFSRSQSTRAADLEPALLLPLWDVGIADEPSGYQMRPTRPDARHPDKPRKYETPPKQPNVLDTNPLMRDAVLDAGSELWVTEGVRKVDSLASIGVPAIGLLGVSSWRGRERPGDSASPTRPLPQWDFVPLADRTVVICFDSDVDEKEQVARARRQLASFLQERGARVLFVTPPDAADGCKQGIDDYLGAGRGRLEDLKRVVPVLDAPPDGRRLLLVDNSADVFDQLEAGLGADELYGFFRRDGVLVHVPLIGEEGYTAPPEGEGQDGPAQVRPVTPTYLRATMQSRFYVARHDQQRNLKHALMPADLATMVVEAAGSWSTVPVIKTVTHTPTMRADGSLLTTPGYDAASRTLLLPAPGLVLKDVPQPVPDEAVKWARHVLEYVLTDFPFTGDESRANALALLLTPLLRNVVPPPYPLFIVNAHQPGSGKTLLSKVATELHGGVNRTELPQNDDELRKQVSGILSTTTAPVVVWDNANAQIKSPILAALLTDMTWNDRLLGTNREVHATNDRVWVTTGNNVVLGGDMARRCYWIKLDPKTPRPELRQDFKQPDLIGYVRAERGHLLTALLVLARRWVEAGRPMDRVRSDSYGGWASAIAEMLQPMGLGAAFASQAQEQVVQAEDDDELGVLLQAVADTFGSRAFQVRDIVEVINRPGETTSIDLDALPGEVMRKCQQGAQLNKVLGWYLSHNQGRYASGRRVVEVGPGRGGKQWRVE